MNDNTSAYPSTLLSSAFVDAVRYAIDKHGTQTRKGTAITYVSHLLAVSALVLEHGGDEQQAIAGLLHDTAEDAGGQAAVSEISHQFGQRVADIVAGCSDTMTVPKPPWRERKERYLGHLRVAPADVVLVSACDKLHNAVSTVRDLRTHRRDAWDPATFNASADDQRWYYRSLLDVFRVRLTDERGRRLLDELEHAVGELLRLSAP